MTLTDKFNIISKTTIDNKLIDNYIKHYLNNETNLIHPDYLYQNTKLNKNNNEILLLLNNNLNKYLLNLKNNIISDENFNLKMIVFIIDDYYKKINYLKKLININDNEFNIIFDKHIFMDQYVITFLEKELCVLDIKNQNLINELLFKMKGINETTYLWYLNLISILLLKNIPKIDIILPNIYYIELNILINYINDIYNYYNFLYKDKIYIYHPIINIIYEKILEIKSEIKKDYKLFLIFLKTKIVYFEKIICNNDYFHSKFKNRFTSLLNINDINSLSLFELYDYLNVIFFAYNINIVDKYIFFIFDNDNCIDQILELINEFINTNYEFVNTLLTFMTNIKSKDLFINKYHEELIKRLLSNNANISNELQLISKLNSIFPEKYIHKLFNTIKDIQISNIELKEFKINNYLEIETKIITLSYNNWNINWNNGYVDCIDNTITKLYDQYYKNIYNNKRKLTWLPQYGEIEIIFNDMNIILFPIQLMVLELFSVQECISIDYIKNIPFFKNYSDQYKINIIKSLIISGILNCTVDFILSISTNIINTNMINVYFSNINTDLNIIELNKSKSDINFSVSDYDLHLSRKYTISTVINHYIKLNSLTYTELYDLVFKNITIFQLNHDIFKNTISWMIENDYIGICDNKYIKLLY